MKVNALEVFCVFFFTTVIKGDNQCGKPGKPVHGYYRDEKESYEMGETVRYECESESFYLTEGRTRTCLTNGIWSGSIPFCVQYGYPDLPVKGNFSQKNESVGRLLCEKDYYLQGKCAISRVNGHWDTNGRYCKRLIPSATVPTSIRCGDPGIPSNGQFNISNNSSSVELSYECDKGFVLIGSKERICERNGTWSPALPKCVRNVAMNKTAKLQRNYNYPTDGFSIDGDNATCETLEQDLGKNKNFNGYIHLKEKVWFDTIQLNFAKIDAREIWVYATNSSNVTKPGFSEYKSLTRIYGGLVNTSFTKLMNATATETEYLVFWIRKSAKICEITAYNSKELTECGQPDQPLNGRIVNRDSDVITFECDHGYRMEGDDDRIRCVDGVWGNKFPVCSLIPPTEPSSSIETVTNRANQSDYRNQSSPSTTLPEPQGYVAKAIIGLGVGVVVTCIILIVAFCIFKRRRARQNQLKQNLTKSNSQSNNSNSVISEDRKPGNSEINEDSSNFYESMETPNAPSSKRSDAEDDHRRRVVQMNLRRLKHDDAVTVENDLYESL